MRFVDLKKQYTRIKDDIDSAIAAVLESGEYILGEEVRLLEQRLAQYVGVKHCVSVSSGTDALMIALMSLGVGHGDEVITSDFSFIATGEVIKLLGAVPVFVDIDPKTYNINPCLIEDAISDKTKAILAVSLFGQCADFGSINAIADQYALPVIEDGAQSFGAIYKNQKSCGLTTIGCTSFFPTKPLGCYGDGGAIFTDNDELAVCMRQLRVHGQDRRYHHVRVGLNGRLDTLQAAILLVKLNIFDAEINARTKIAQRYTSLLKQIGIDTPYIAPGNNSVYAQYTIKINNRDWVQARMSEEAIPTAVHYPIPLHKQPALKNFNACFKEAEIVSEKVLSLPMHPYLEQQNQDKIIGVLSKIVNESNS